MYLPYNKFIIDVVVILFVCNFPYVLNVVTTLVEEDNLPKFFFKNVMLEFMI